MKLLKSMMFSAFWLGISVVTAPAQETVSDMMTACQVEAAVRLGGDTANTSTEDAGGRTDGTYAINGKIRINGKSTNFQCSFGPDRSTIVNFWTNADKGGAAQKPAGSDKKSVRVKFKSGSNSATLEGTLAPGASIHYLVGARNEQFLTVELIPNGKQINYTILNPDGSLLYESAKARLLYTGQLWQDGDHVVKVFNNGAKSASFTLNLRIE